jgi:tRNA(Ile2) C34 agmatinyltransferase TiaS
MVNTAIINKICIQCGHSMVRVAGGYRCLICGREYTDHQIQVELSKLKAKGMRWVENKNYGLKEKKSKN